MVLAGGCAGSASEQARANKSGEQTASAATQATAQTAVPAPAVAAAEPARPAAPAAAALPAVPAPGTTVRVGGDASAAIRQEGDNYFFGSASITTPLPAGYPAPTPPGAIDMKTYPSVRRAQISGSVTPDLGMNVGFFPLFNHIKRREIAMTSPVEMDYTGMSNSGDNPDGWTMAFLYRTPELGDVGADERDERVKVLDTQPVTVLAIGLQGFYRVGRIRDGVAALEKWLADNPQWEAAGDARAFYYNGPEKRNRDKWAEAQLPIRPRATPAASGTGPSGAAPVTAAR
ncbi:MAG: heme-binding protein [Planctomycetaceae bacterium]|nr:heme-binding protein [Planctomycetaceae bacterium]